MFQLITAMTFPFILGISHCFESDHLLAVATLDDSTNRNVKSLLLKGATWGVGHSIPVLICGLVYIYLKVFLLQEVPINLEVPVGSLLIGMGIYRLIAYNTVQIATNKKHYLTVGIIHGLAGSAGIVLIHFTKETNLLFQSIYLVLFSFGAIIGMGGVNVIISKISSVFDRLKFLQLITPILSIIYGCIMIYNYV